MLGPAGTQERCIAAKAKAMEQIRNSGGSMRLFPKGQAIDAVEKRRECTRAPIVTAIFAIGRLRDWLELGDPKSRRERKRRRGVRFRT
jgi:hypothetical protein